MAVTNAVSWRSEGIKYKKNEVFLDVVESVNLLVNSNGTVVRSEVVGALKMRTFLSGMPECKLGLNDKVRSLHAPLQFSCMCGMTDSQVATYPSVIDSWTHDIQGDLIIQLYHLQDMTQTQESSPHPVWHTGHKCSIALPT